MELYETFGEAVGNASVRYELVDLLTKSGRLLEARPLLDEAEDIFGKLDDRFGKAITSNSYGAWYLAAGQFDEARRRYTEALELALEIGSLLERAAALAGLAQAAKALGEHDAAERGFRIDFTNLAGVLAADLDRPHHRPRARPLPSSSRRRCTTAGKTPHLTAPRMSAVCLPTSRAPTAALRGRQRHPQQPWHCFQSPPDTSEWDRDLSRPLFIDSTK